MRERRFQGVQQVDDYADELLNNTEKQRCKRTYSLSEACEKAWENRMCIYVGTREINLSPYYATTVILQISMIEAQIILDRESERAQLTFFRSLVA